MNSFEYYNPARIIYGLDSLDQLQSQVKTLGAKILLHYGQTSIKRTGLYDEIMDILGKSGVEVFELGGVVANPEIDLVLKGIEICKDQGIEGILAVGGGSVIDSAKAIAAGVGMDLDIEEAYFSNLEITHALPIGCVLTIPAAGSESSNSSVVSVHQGKHKRSIKSEAIIPKFAIINPRLFTTLSKSQAAAGISDIMAHLLERYFTHTEHVDFTDRLLEGAMKCVIKYGPLVVHDLQDIDAWSELGFVGNLAHNGLLGMGRQQDWASHRIEHELSARYGIAHGLGLAIVFPAWMKYVFNENPKRFKQFAQRVFDIEPSLSSIEEGIAAYEQFLISMDLPTRLSEAGIFKTDIEFMVENVFENRVDSFGNFKKIKKEDMRKILEIAQ